jgi:hypothetical protein
MKRDVNELVGAFVASCRAWRCIRARAQLTWPSAGAQSPSSIAATQRRSAATSNTGAHSGINSDEVPEDETKPTEAECSTSAAA